MISNETIEYVGLLAELYLSDEDKEQAKHDISNMINYIDMLKELDSTDVVPMVQTISINNFFRDDIVTNENNTEDTVKNAPDVRENKFAVPATFD